MGLNKKSCCSATALFSVKHRIVFFFFVFLFALCSGGDGKDCGKDSVKNAEEEHCDDGLSSACDKSAAKNYNNEIESRSGKKMESETGSGCCVLKSEQHICECENEREEKKEKYPFKRGDKCLVLRGKKGSRDV